MDGKKRIARLRNAIKMPKFRKMGDIPLPKPELKPTLVQHHAPVELRESVKMFKSKMDCKPLSSGIGFANWLNKRGWKVLGSGCYSTVYGKEGYDKVFKITAGAQDNWIDYIQWSAKKGYCGNFAPRVYSWKKFKGKDGHAFSVSIVERMQCSLAEAQMNDYSLVESLTYPVLRGHSLASLYMEVMLPGYLKFVKELYKEFNANDMYSKNMMLRKDGTFCLTDPVCGRSATTKTRLRSTDFMSVTPACRGLFESCYRH